MPHRPGRADFEIAPRVAWLNGAMNSPLPRVARAAVIEAYEFQASPDRLPGDAVMRFPDEVREGLGAVLGLPAAEIGITHSSVFGAMLLAQAMTWEAGDRVLIAPDEFPANAYPWFALESRGVRVERIGTAGEPLRADQLARALAAGGRTRVLAVGATHYLSGDLHPLATFAALLHERDAVMVVDASQTAGAVAVPWGACGADAILMSGYKWLLGPYGTGALWVRDDLRDPLARVGGNWWALEVAPDMDTVMRDYPRAFKAHGRSLDAGQSASYLNIACWRAGLDHLRAIGVAAVEAHHRALQDRLVAALAGTPLHAITTLDGAHRSPLLMLEAEPGVDMKRLCDELARRDVHVSARSGRMRVSPGIWNDEGDIDVFAAALADALAVAR